MTQTPNVMNGHADPILSVLLPVRQHPSSLEKTISSIKFQTFTDWEIVVLLDRDDGTNRKKIAEWISNNRVVFVDVDISKDGFAVALNLGVGFCRGKFIARCDDDDVSDLTRFEQQVQVFETNPAVVVVTGWATVVDGHGNLKSEIRQPLDITQLKRALCQANNFPHSATTFNREAFMRCGGYKFGLDGCEDYELWMRLALDGDLKSTGTHLITYLDNAEGMSRWVLTGDQLKFVRVAQRNLLRNLKVSFLVGELIIFNFRFRQVVSQLTRHFSL